MYEISNKGWLSSRSAMFILHLSYRVRSFLIYTFRTFEVHATWLYYIMLNPNLPFFVLCFGFWVPLFRRTSNVYCLIHQFFKVVAFLMDLGAKL
jgi:hypothetical protein